MVKNKKIVGIVLSGGKSSRMGSEKGLVEWKGKRLIEYSIEALQPICDQLVISSNMECYNYLGYPIIEDEIKDCGPLGGIYSCMKAVKADYYLVISCDVPNVSFLLFADLLKNIAAFDAIFPIDKDDRKQPLIAVYGSSCKNIIEKELFQGNFKMMKLLDLLQTGTFQISEELPYYNSKMLSNVNSPKDINSL
ncbi:molybdenum cofactor guanylyltransferase [Labilibaculum euxinus]|uniref:Probable molybdenum cofactor guanylyltransferase n=1 Tax=Labilibaculum euxinus TaxID=2686357 RepID=A0A7M4D7B5_9BACT|nr:molybdenum cofactor guanylyltransferase [Labilibaculum euxinus]MUP38544.1 NTP transferase domain-containing protein [Labilibaculum euxinus]MVB07749.1 NTP transferase domain-containing protein [Labilibaculum euxinus]